MEFNDNISLEDVIQWVKNQPLEVEKKLREFIEEDIAVKQSNKVRRASVSKSEFGAFKSKVKMSPDFDAPLNDFWEYM